MLLLAIGTCQFCNFVWLNWILHTHIRLPQTLKKHTTKALMGKTGGLMQDLGVKLLDLKDKAYEAYQARQQQAPPAAVQ